jgi:two-component system OmpR family sensor kinase
VFLPSGAYGALIDRTGLVRRGPVADTFSTGHPPAPVFPAKVPVSSPGSSPKLFTVNSKRGSGFRYRAAALGLEGRAGTILVAVPLRDVDQTLDRLVLVEALVTASIVIVLMCVGWFVIRVALRPLDQMGRVAGAIAAGDLSHRVTPATSRTEIGRLGLTLNRMLMRIEEAFEQRARSDERRRQFLSDASHELRTPLASIRGYAELFRLGPAQDPKALGRAMARIESEAKRMASLVDDLLILARLDELPEDRRTGVELTELCAQAAADARAMATDRTISFNAPGQIEVPGDPGALRQVMANLMANAVIHTPDGTPIEVTLRRDRDEAVIRVRDHGPGLPEGSQERVFERFWRSEAGRARGPGGSGLGLSIVREIVQAHHGTVRARNHPGGGAEFVVRVPEAPQGPPADGPEYRAQTPVGVSASG